MVRLHGETSVHMHQSQRVFALGKKHLFSAQLRFQKTSVTHRYVDERPLRCLNGEIPLCDCIRDNECALMYSTFCSCSSCL